MSTEGGGGGQTPFQAELSSIDQAHADMATLTKDMQKLHSDFSSFADGVHPTDWSEESACVAFGTSYTAALGVYTEVIGGLAQDVERYMNALATARKNYDDTDGHGLERMNTMIAALDAPTAMANASRGRTAYEAPGRHAALSSDKPEQATDTSPGDGSTTVLPGQNGGTSTSGSPSSGSGSSGSTTSGSTTSGSTTSGSGTSGSGSPSAAPTSDSQNFS